MVCMKSEDAARKLEEISKVLAAELVQDRKKWPNGGDDTYSARLSRFIVPLTISYCLKHGPKECYSGFEKKMGDYAKLLSELTRAEKVPLIGEDKEYIDACVFLLHAHALLGECDAKMAADTLAVLEPIIGKIANHVQKKYDRGKDILFSWETDLIKTHENMVDAIADLQKISGSEQAATGLYAQSIPFAFLTCEDEGIKEKALSYIEKMGAEKTLHDFLVSKDLLLASDRGNTVETVLKFLALGQEHREIVEAAESLKPRLITELKKVALGYAITGDGRFRRNVAETELELLRAFGDFTIIEDVIEAIAEECRRTGEFTRWGLVSILDAFCQESVTPLHDAAFNKRIPLEVARGIQQEISQHNLSEDPGTVFKGSLPTDIRAIAGGMIGIRNSRSSLASCLRVP